jgi:hypothetical protein
MKIFVQIASYRDPELLPTIRDCINKAKHPENLTFGICWQHDETESMKEFANDSRFKILDYHWSLSKGLCWARSEIQKLWDNEEYTLQLDSHHRFLQDWDVELIEMMKQTGSEKPIITSYAGMYRPSTNELLNTEPYKMVASNFTPGGTILFRPHSISGWETLEKPIPARFVSGHFFFTIGKHCEEYKYDPDIYFAGDEISLSIRSFTMGYDIFHPHKLIVWHEYSRKGRIKHWDDFNESNKNNGNVTDLWHVLDSYSKQKLRKLLQEEDNNIDIGIYGLGNVRSHSDYEKYAGINFKLRKLHPDCVSGIEPPVIYTDDTWLTDIEINYNYTFTIPPAVNFKFIFIGIETDARELLFRKDLTEYVDTLVVNFTSVKKPYKWVYWVYDREKKWDKRIDTIL